MYRAPDRNIPKWARLVASEDIAGDPDNVWRENVPTQVALGKRFERVQGALPTTHSGIALAGT
ncbi:hypothetical protein ACQ86D_18550 [Streptomyces galilaeus]